MKKLLFLALGGFALIACNNAKTTSSEEIEPEASVEQHAIGGDTDEHGCLTAAGQTWSELQQDCVQIFNVGQRLNPVNHDEREAEFSAFVLLNEDQSKAELFLPKAEGNHILDKGAGNNYTSGSYRYDSDKKELFYNDEMTFKAEE